MKAMHHLIATLGLSWGLLVATSAWGQGKVAVSDNARQHFKAGVAYIDDPAGAKFEEAYREFRVAYNDSPSYRILSNLGLCALNLERDGEAIEAYEGFLAKATAEDIPKDKRALMERDVATLKSSLVMLKVTGRPATLMLTDERIPSKGSSVINRYIVKDGNLSLGIHPGHHIITVSADGYEPQRWELEGDAAASFSHDFQLKPVGDAASTHNIESSSNAPASSGNVVTAKAQTQDKISPFVYVGLAATGAFAIGATVTGLIANAKFNDYATINRTGDDPGRANDLKSSGQTFALVTDIGIAAALLSAGATAIVYLVGPSSKTETKASAARWQIVPSLGSDYAQVEVTGQF